jgi:hypothetical protein
MANYYQSLGALDIEDLIKKGGPALQAASKVIQDPALPEIICHVLRLNKITEGKSPGPVCAKINYTAAQKRTGLGLARVTKPLRAAVWARQHPAVAAGIGAGVVGFIWFVGYRMGK